jgi:hypothetical protein
VVASVAALLAVVVGCARGGDDSFAWTPADAPAVERGRQAGMRFGLTSMREISVDIDNVFSPANQQALGLAEQRLAEIPGVRSVLGPAALLDISVDAGGKPRARRALAATGSAAAGQVGGEAERQRIVRRADALGWFLADNGRRARFYIDGDDWERVAPAITAALVGSGLALAQASSEVFSARAVLPDPRQRGGWLPVQLAAAGVLFVMLAALRAGVPPPARSRARKLGLALTVGAGAAAVFALVPVPGVRAAGGVAAAGAAALALLVASLAFPKRSAVVASRPSAGIALVAAALALGGLLVSGRVRIATEQWAAAPLAFVSIRGDLDEPVVLREMRRLVDELRAQPEVASAWSVADLFTGVRFEGDEPSGIPDEADDVRRILVQARSDPAVRLELSGDHREALIAIRFADAPTVDRGALFARLERYIERELRRSLAHVDLSAPGTSFATRSFGQGLLALDARERVLRICERSGRALGPAEVQSVERAARQAATIPAVDPARLSGELASAVRDFISRHPFPLPAAELNRLVATMSHLPDDATVDDIRVALAAAYGARMPEAILNSTAASLARLLSAVRRRLVTRAALREMMNGADLPSEGALADEVRGATAEAMGPVVGLPVAAGAPSAFTVDAQPIGGVANDRALSAAWNQTLRSGVAAAAVVIGLLLLLAGGVAGLLALPVALAPLAAAIAPAALLGEPIGLPTLSFLAAALAGGAALAFVWTPARGVSGTADERGRT